MKAGIFSLYCINIMSITESLSFKRILMGLGVLASLNIEQINLPAKMMLVYNNTAITFFRGAFMVYLFTKDVTLSFATMFIWSVIRMKLSDYDPVNMSVVERREEETAVQLQVTGDGGVVPIHT
jgi:hypothetical protein